MYQVQGDPSLTQVDPVAKKKKVLEELSLNESPFLRCDPQLRREVEDLIGDFLDVFTDEGRAVGRVEDSFFHSFKIQLESGARPVKEGIRPLSHQQKEALKEQLRVWLRDGVIRPGTSPWGSALVPVKKKDGSWRWTIDYRAVNKVTVPDSFPTPRIDSLIDSLGGSAVFSSLDKKCREQAFFGLRPKIGHSTPPPGQFLCT